MQCYSYHQNITNHVRTLMDPLYIRRIHQVLLRSVVQQIQHHYEWKTQFIWEHNLTVTMTQSDILMGNAFERIKVSLSES